MRTRSRRLSSAVTSAAVLAIAATGCATRTAVKDVWATRNASAPMRNILVMGARTDQATRHTVEDGFAMALARHGIRATTSYSLFHDAFPSAAEAHDIVQKVGFDGLLVATSKGTTERAVVAGGDFWSDYYYGPSWLGWYPGYVYTDELVRFETTLWDERAGGKMVFAALTQTTNPSSGRDFARSLTKAVIPAMTNAGLLPPLGSRETLSMRSEEGPAVSRAP